MQEKDKPGVIVLGGHVQALGILRIFGQNNVPSIIVDNTKNNIARHSRYCHRFYLVENSSLLTFLTGLGIKKQYVGWILIPTNDLQLNVLSVSKTELEKYFKVATDKWEVVKLFYNKVETYKFVRKLSIPIPGTYTPADEADLADINCKFPCIIKPSVMHEFYREFKKKVFICRNRNELLKYYRKALAYIPAEDIMIQEIIQGPSRNQFSACFLIFNGKLFTFLAACRMRQHPLDFGNATTYAETVDIPVLKEYGEKILEAANYNGICEIEFKRDEDDGEYKFLEVNARTWKWHTIAIEADAPFLMNLYNFYLGKQLNQTNKFKTASFRHGLTDIPVQLKLLLKGYNYAFRVRKPVVNAVWSRRDILPWVYEKLYLFYLLRTR
jgi:predicted ATP-grasp superfamily ATP-dependent carboligase